MHRCLNGAPVEGAVQGAGGVARQGVNGEVDARPSEQVVGVADGGIKHDALEAGLWIGSVPAYPEPFGVAGSLVVTEERVGLLVQTGAGVGGRGLVTWIDIN